MQQMQQIQTMGTPSGAGYLNGDESLLSMDCKEFNRWLKRHEFTKDIVDAMKKVGQVPPCVHPGAASRPLFAIHSRDA